MIRPRLRPANVITSDQLRHRNLISKCELLTLFCVASARALYKMHHTKIYRNNISRLEIGLRNQKPRWHQILLHSWMTAEEEHVLLVLLILVILGLMCARAASNIILYTFLFCESGSIISSHLFFFHRNFVYM